MSNLVSVVICTYNRGDLIEGCLDSLADQTADPNSFEVIVVDNNSSDNTLQVMEHYQRLPNLRIFFEEKQGLSHARNRGLAEAKGSYIAYLDDDAKAERHYIENLFVLLDQFSDSIDCYGGPILPFYTSPKPDWFKDKYETRRDWETTRYLNPGQSFSGSNMIWKRSTLKSLGGFNLEVGIKGNKLILGEETLLFNRLFKGQSPRLFYSPELIVFHWVPEKKMRVSYQLKRARATGNFLGFEIKYQNSTRINEILSSLFLLLKSSIKALFLFPSYRKWQNWAVETLSPIEIEIGKISSMLLKSLS
jgi:glycosyltransferase involved in cell wall biosynthesis